MRKKNNSHTIRYGPGSYRPAPNGRGYDCTVTRLGTRSRARMPGEKEARAWIDATEAAIADTLPPLTRAQLIDAREAIAILPPGTTLTAAARIWASANTQHTGITLTDARDLFLTERAQTIKPKSLASYRQAINRLIRRLPSQSLLTQADTALCAQELQNRSPGGRNNLLRNWSAFFHWAIAAGHINTDPLARIPRARIPEPPRGTLSIEQTRALLQAAIDLNPRIIPYLTLALFAGIRPAELTRLQPEAIKKDFILIDGSVAKTADTRSIPIQSNLRAWLDTYPPPAGHVIAPKRKKCLYADIRKLCQHTCKSEQKACKIHTWPTDCMRHSYATYAYELNKDAALVAYGMGHRGTDIFFRHYRALCQPGDGAKYFAIMPTDCQQPS